MSDLKSSSDLDEFVLHVSNIPEELDADGLERVFRQYGIVTSLVAPDNKFAFVSYKTYAEAESAIANLNQQKPMFMRVKFSSRSANYPDSKAIPEGLLTPVTPGSKPPGGALTPIGERDYRFNESGLPYHGRTPLTLPAAPMSATRYEMNARHYPINPELYKYFDELEYPESSSLWTRGQLTLDTLGQRKVSGGRGYVYYAIPDPNPAAVSRANKLLELRSPGRFGVGSDHLSHLVDKCIACRRDAVHCCANCASSYCSRDCQFRDWPRHKNECSNVPPLLEKSKVANGVHENDSAAESPKLKSPILKPPLKNQDLTNVTADPPKKSAVVSSSEFLSAPKRSPVPEKQPPINERAPEDPRDALKRSKSHPEEHRRQEFSRQSSAPEKKPDLNARLEKSRLPNLNLDQDFAFQKPFLSSGGFTEVQIVDVHAPSIFSVQKTSELLKLTELMKELNEKITKCPKVSEIIPEKFYGALFDGIWHRVQLILGPKPKLDYVDYGTIVDATPDLELRDIGALSEVPRYACLIRVPTVLPSSPEYSSLGPERKILVKMVNQDQEGIINVQVLEKEPKESKSLPQPRKTPSVESVSKMRPPKIATKEPPPALELPSVISRLPKGALASVEIPQVIDGNSATCVVLTEDLLDFYNQLLMPLKEDCDKAAPEYSTFIPKVNDVVCGLKKDGFWVRARVLAVTPKLKVASLDEGIICEAVKTIPMVSKYADIPTFACLIQTSDVFPLQVNSTAYVVVNNKASASLEGEFVETKSKFELKPWISSVESLKPQNGGGEHQNGRQAPNGRLGENGAKFEIGAKFETGAKIQTAEIKEIEQIIKNNSSVAVQAFRDASILFVRSLETKEVERYSNVVQEAARQAQTAPKVSKVSIGDKVLAQFKLDDNFYRAIVVDVKGQEVKIAYLDFGNQEVTEIERLREMPEALKQQEDGCVKVVLKGIEKFPLTPEASAYLGTIADQETPFILSYESKVQDGVVLTARDGVRVNDKVNKFIKPKFDEKQEEIFKLTDIEMGKLGSVGADTTALCLGVLEPGYKYIFAPMDRELIAHLSTVMPAQLMEYAQKTQFYIPRFNELCVALFEGEWCRGCCFNPTAKENTAEIYFMDYGNIAPVKHEDLRKMPEEFMKPCALGCICNVVDIAPQNSNPSPQLLAKLKELLITNQSFNIRIVMYEDDEWTIELPEITVELKKAGLI